MFVKYFAVAVVAAAPVACHAVQFIKQGNFSVATAGPVESPFVATTNARAITGADYVRLAGGYGSAAAQANIFASFGAGNIGGVETLAQSFETVSGKTYILSFDYGAFGGDQPFELFVGGRSVMTYAPTGTMDLDSMFTHTSLSFIGSGRQTEILFRVLAGLDDNADVLIDNVGVSAVPEVATWVLMIAGFVMVGVSARNRGRLHASD